MNIFIHVRNVIRMLLVAAVLLGVWLLLRWCTPKQWDTASQNNQKETTPVVVKLGVIAPISWPAASYGEDYVNVVKHYTDEFNASQKAYKIDVIVEDGKCGGKDATAAAQKLINVDRVAMIYGWACSSETLGAWKIAQDAKTFMVSAVSSAPDISKIWDYVYRYYDDAIATTYVSKFVAARANKIALIAENTDFAQGMANAFKTEYTGEIAYNTTFNSDEKDFNIIAKNIASKTSDIEFIVVINQSDSTFISIAKALIDNDLRDSFKNKIFFSVGIDSAAAKEALWNNMEGLYSYNAADLTKVGTNIDIINAFDEKYKVKSDKNYVVLEIELIQAIIDGIKAWNTTSDSLKAYFDNFKQQRRSGIFWPYYFDERRTAVGINYIITQVKNGKVATVE